MLGRYVIITGAKCVCRSEMGSVNYELHWGGGGCTYCIATIFDYGCSLIGNASCCCQRCALFIRVRSGLPVFGMVVFWSNYSLVCEDWIWLSFSSGLFFWKVICVCLVWESFSVGKYSHHETKGQRVRNSPALKRSCAGLGVLFQAPVRQWNMIQKGQSTIRCKILHNGWVCTTLNLHHFMFVC